MLHIDKTQHLQPQGKNVTAWLCRLIHRLNTKSQTLLLWAMIIHVLHTWTCILFSHQIYKDGLAYVRKKKVLSEKWDPWGQTPLPVFLFIITPHWTTVTMIHTSYLTLSTNLCNVYSSFIKPSFLWIVTHSSQLNILSLWTQLNTQRYSLREAILCYCYCKTPTKRKKILLQSLIKPAAKEN